MRKKLGVFFLLCIWGIVFGYSQKDSLRIKELFPIEIKESKRPTTVRASTPTQTIGKESIELSGIVYLSDAAKRLTGVTMRDYGGVGGLKTIASRGLGTQFSGIAIDGITILDCQNGQVDLGRYNLSNVEYISFANGQMTAELISARSYSSANFLNIETKYPKLAEGKRINLRAGIDVGSFGYWNPKIVFESGLSKKTALSLSASHVQSKGNYPFTVYYGRENDSTSHERRDNSDVKISNIDLNFFYNISSKQRLKVKTNIFLSERGLPGPVTWYTKKTSERLQDKTFFLQTHYENEVSEKFRFGIRGKYNYAYVYYLDTLVPNVSGRIDNQYYQQEGYISAIFKYNVLKDLSLNYSSDFFVNTLTSNLDNNKDPYRYNWMNAFAVQYENDRITVSGSLLSTYVQEYNDKQKYKTYNKWTPFISLLYKPLKEENFFLRYFYKESYRMPNFNELYFYSEPNLKLTSEKARQHNLGISLIREIPKLHALFSLTVDGYYNNVSDKIVADPRQNLFLWSVYNIGKVETLGIDVNFSSDVNFTEENFLLLSANYSFQHSVDKTKTDSKTYLHQIPYVPKHSGGFSCTFKHRWFYATYSLLVSGKRYYLSQNTKDHEVPGYTEHSIMVGKDFMVKNLEMKGYFQVMNLFDQQYEVVKSYPMQGRFFKIGLEIKY